MALPKRNSQLWAEFGKRSPHPQRQLPPIAPAQESAQRDSVLVGLVVGQLLATSLLCLMAVLSLDFAHGAWQIALLAGAGAALIGLLMTGGFVLGARRASKKTENACAACAEGQMTHNLEVELGQLKKMLRIAEHKAQAANLAKQAFVSQLNHDIRTPLNHILGFTELMRKQTFGSLGDARYLAYLDDITRSGEVLMQSFGQILELAAIDTGQTSLNVTDIDFSRFESRLQMEYDDKASKRGIGLSIALPRDIHLSADFNCLHRIVAQLLSNALRFTPRGGEVRLDAFRFNDSVVFRVTDTGVGIGPEQLEMLNLPFAFADYESRARAPGKGMGLAVSRTLAELSGGELRIDSTLGVGTTVAVQLPARPLAVLPASASKTETSAWLVA
ncbi:MAG: HAMP domain-containing histidine kinase [Hyphomicrobiaceae bacterium]|nr:HAMP domain-containing histidine kinase [Hyphomicrobiaceae bacterium]